MYIITARIQWDKQTGPAYKLVEFQTGKSHKYLVIAARLKKYNDERREFEAKYPATTGGELSGPATEQDIVRIPKRSDRT